MELDTIRELLGDAAMPVNVGLAVGANAGLILSGVLSIVFAWQMLNAWRRKDDLMAMIYFVAVWMMLNSAQISLMSKKLGV
jgi:predicted ferric reductase